jgi:hypothetical protein
MLLLLLMLLPASASISREFPAAAHAAAGFCQLRLLPMLLRAPTSISIFCQHQQQPERAVPCRRIYAAYIALTKQHRTTENKFSQ